ncbi:MAG: DUF488 family protein [Propionibacterium sp.]
MPVVIKRVQEAATPDDGERILVDRLWPRGISHERAQLDGWAKEIAPTAALRIWFHHDPERMAEFTRRYRAELETRPEAREAVQHLLDTLEQGKKITLVYAAKDPELNQAKVLAEYLTGR